MKTAIDGKGYLVGDKVLCRFHDDTYGTPLVSPLANAEIVDIRPADQSSKEESKEMFLYYIHYTECEECR